MSYISFPFAATEPAPAEAQPYDSLLYGQDFGMTSNETYGDYYASYVFSDQELCFLSDANTAAYHCRDNQDLYTLDDLTTYHPEQHFQNSFGIYPWNTMFTEPSGPFSEVEDASPTIDPSVLSLRPDMSYISTDSSGISPPATPCNTHLSSRSPSESPMQGHPSLTCSPVSSLSEHTSSDVDAAGATDSEFEYGGSSSFTDDDEDYVPLQSSKSRCPRKKSSATKRKAKVSPAASTSRRTGVQRTPRSSRARTSRSAPYPPPSSPSSSTDELLIHTAPRIEQVATPFVPLSQADRDLKACPLCDDTFNRPVDVARHYERHFSHALAGRHICHGVHVDRAAEYDVDVTAGDAREFRGEMRVGKACWKTFSRRDALIRHLKNRRSSCVSDTILAEAYFGVKSL